MFDNNKTTVTGALLLALALLVQSLRLVLPLPLFVSMFIVGTLLNAILFVAVSVTGIKSTLVIAWLTPLVALLEGQLPGIPFVPLVAAGNTVYAAMLVFLKKTGGFSALAAASAGKAAFLFFGAWALLSALAFPPPASTAFSFVMSWPQLFTALAGGLAGRFILARLGRGG
jgi:hypothetical protein